MAKLDLAPLYPINLSANGVPVNLCKNRTPEDKFQIVRVLKPGGPKEGDFDVLWEGDSEFEADPFAREQIEKEFPGLMSQQG